MKIPNIKCKIEMFCTVNPSEDPDKVKKAISNIFPYSIIKTENSSVSAQSKKPIKVKELIEKSEASSSIVKTLIDKKILKDASNENNEYFI